MFLHCFQQGRGFPLVPARQIFFRWFQQDRAFSTGSNKTEVFPLVPTRQRFSIGSHKAEVFLGIITKHKSKFNYYVIYLRKKVGQKLDVLASIAFFVEFNKMRSIMQAFIESEFGYSFLLWVT